MKVLLLSKYSRLGASSRLRSYQYLPFLEARGIQVTVAPLFGDDYLDGLYEGNPLLTIVLRAYIRRLVFMLRARRFDEIDVVWMEKEMLPWLPAWFELSLLKRGIPLVVDYDDAVFHRYDQHRSIAVRTVMRHKIDVIMHRAAIVIVGNDYLAVRARRAGAVRVEYLPTVVNLQRYAAPPLVTQNPVTIGWIGTPWTMRYLSLIAPVIIEMAATGLARFVAVGPNTEKLAGLPMEVRPWSEESEVSELQQFDIGIMPLPDESFERGKCGYKLIQYMACGKPVVASPIGANTGIVHDGVEGFFASDLSQWREALQLLCAEATLRQRMGAAGRARVEAKYSLQIAAPRLEALLRSVAL